MRALSRQVMAQLELQRQTRELRAANERFEMMARATNDAVWDWDLLTDVVYWSEGYRSLFGYPSPATGSPLTSWTDFIHPEDHDRVLDGIRRVIVTGGTAWSDEYRFRRLDQAFADVADRGTVIRDGSGRALRMIGAMQDVSARKRTESRYRSLFEYAPDGILIADTQSYYLDANASLCRMLGYTRQELIGMHGRDIVAQAEVSQIEAALSAIQSRADYHQEWQLRRKDGTLFPAEVMVTPMPDGNLLAMIRDVTERKRIEGRFRRLMESNVQGVMFWNSTGEVIRANNAFLGIVDYSCEDLEEGRIHWGAMTPPEFAEADRRAAEEIARVGVCRPYEKELIRRDGSRVAIFIGAAGFEDSPGEGVCFVLDLTDRKRLEQQFLRAQRMESIGTLAGGIAHDLNNVLAPILLSVEMLKEMVTDEDGQSMLTTLERSAERGAALVQQVLSFARGVEGRRVEINAIHLVRELLVVMRDTFPKSISLAFKSNPALWTVMGDPTQIHQVMMNLCVNARDAMPDGGSLTIALENVAVDAPYAAKNLDAHAGPYVLLRISDTGSGVPAEIRDRVFEPFFTTKEVGKGTGLGLSTSLAIVRSHGGFIHLDSEMNVGTSFSVYLPANAAKTAADAVVLAQGRLPRGHGEMVLVVDDEEAIRDIARRTLERFGYRVMVANNGADAVALYRAHQADIAVVLTDMAMPVMGGPAAIEAFIAINPAVKVIGTSGFSSLGSGTKVELAGVKHFVSKPYTAEALLKILQQSLGNLESGAGEA